MGAFISLKRTGGTMIAAAVLSFVVMIIHREYIACLPIGGEDVLGELFFGIQTVLLVAEMILGLLAVGSCIFLRSPMDGMLSCFLKLLLIAAVSAAALGIVWLVAYFGEVNAVSAAILILY
ncbi:MAG: hypothetical protein J6K92_04515 [Oscillospiraceae bacterium]|nr:hypothetical protein [Oscillospiraceae bacterium]